MGCADGLPFNDKLLAALVFGIHTGDPVPSSGFHGSCINLVHRQNTRTHKTKQNNLYTHPSPSAPPFFVLFLSWTNTFNTPNTSFMWFSVDLPLRGLNVFFATVSQVLRAKARLLAVLNVWGMTYQWIRLLSSQAGLAGLQQKSLQHSSCWPFDS